MEVKAVAVSLLQRYHLELLPGQDYRPHTMPTLSPRYGVRVRVLPKELAWRGALAHRTPRRVSSSTSSSSPVHSLSTEELSPPPSPLSRCPVHSLGGDGGNIHPK
jgi:hypothetical protein